MSRPQVTVSVRPAADELAEIVRSLTRFWRKNPHARAAIADRSDNLRDMLDRLVALPRALTERTTRPPFPPSLRSVEDVRQVCESAGLSEVRWNSWAGPNQIAVDAGESGVELDSTRLVLDADYPVPASLLAAAIRSAREETP